ncbi:uncharacterized protein MONOS_12340 [Monocercomonoides exilis]|uniref:uncharacterized protein n=1 Tax=Monocercomonoides exilis TaxID=2049356 RepID=UPI00355ABCC7|nr:hypothetical protein MONOS_12340 [Monocercomonoides exilis]|eukprot:MONOS_12340.1-p1 / transcript=MONOS_12340.1 / gene=MONOS_12340 / organism=Monocercomonoides_exilis_PA203 / gene_product=unspecified product / transcript_product=unspecified product / location=Mono_scaffold00678:9195-9621(-) / protein_length=107 / sequence_SO=supercontig / SO=protein_coding / is_pseudo=false
MKGIICIYSAVLIFSSFIKLVSSYSENCQCSQKVNLMDFFAPKEAKVMCKSSPAQVSVQNANQRQPIDQMRFRRNYHDSSETEQEVGKKKRSDKCDESFSQRATRC